MTKRNKLIIGALVVLGAYYLYDRNRKMTEVAKLKAGADKTAQQMATTTSGTKSLIETVGTKPVNLRAEAIKLNVNDFADMK